MTIGEKVMDITCVNCNAIIKDKVGTSRGGKVPFSTIIEVVMDDTWMGIQNKKGKWILSKKVKGCWMKKEGTKVAVLDEKPWRKVPNEKR